MAQSDEEDQVDARLLAEIAAGSERAFVELYRRRHNDVYRFALAMARSRSFAQDVVQQVFLNVLENASRFDRAKGSARAWLCGCARHLTLDRLRLERRWTDEFPAHDSVRDGDERLFADQRIERLHAGLARLPVEYREALVLVAGFVRGSARVRDPRSGGPAGRCARAAESRDAGRAAVSEDCGVAVGVRRLLAAGAGLDCDESVDDEPLARRRFSSRRDEMTFDGRQRHFAARVHAPVLPA